MQSLLSYLTAGAITLSTSLQAQQGLHSARQALAEHLPDIAALRIESFLATKPELSQKEKENTLLLLGEAHLRAGNPDKTLTVLKNLPNVSNESRNFWQGLALARQQNFPQALSQLALVSKENPLYSQALCNRIEIHRNLAQTEAAFETLSKLRHFDANYKPNELALLEARLFLDSNKPEEASQALTKLDSATRKEDEALLLTGRIALAANQPTQALEAFESIQIDQNQPTLTKLTLLGKTDAILASEEPEKALPHLLQLLSLDSKETFLDLLPARFEKLLATTSNKNDLLSSLATFVSPETLGEDSNYANPRKLLACYYLARISSPEEATSLSQQALSLQPEGEIAARFHLESARLALQDNSLAATQEHLNAILKTAPHSPLTAQASDLLARLATEKGNLKQAQKLFAKATQHPNQEFAEQALLNQALLQLTQNPTDSLSALSTKLTNSKSAPVLSLEKALALAQQKSPQAIDKLRTFITDHPTHPRLEEARLALIERLLEKPQPDFETITTQLASLPELLEQPQSLVAFQLCHRFGAITNDWSLAVARGESHRKNFLTTENDPFFLLSLAESTFRNGKNFRRAHVLFTKVANLPNAGELAEVALFFSARASLEIPTSESTGEGHRILDQLIQNAGRLTTQARLLKARTLLKSQGKPRECLQTLQGIPGQPGDQPEAALLTAKAFRELAAKNPADAKRAVSIYQRLIADKRTSYSLSNQLHYQLALTYRENEQAHLAIDPCYTVINFENRKADEVEVEWDYFYRCGFEAIDILLEANRPQAALTLARKLAKTKGPGAKQVQERAEQIQLDHLLWTD